MTASVFGVANKVLEKLGTLAYQEICLAWGVKTELQKLQITMTTIKAVLLDAEEKQEEDCELSIWLGRLKDVFYDAEDVLDEFDVEALRRQVVNHGSLERKVCRFFSHSNPLAFRFQMGHKIKEIRERVDEIAAIKAKFLLKERLDDRSHVHREREITHSFVRASDVIGRDKDREIIINKLMQSSDHNIGENISVIPIVGIGGLGKTTLAKMVYNDEKIVKLFQRKMWVCVSDNFDVTKIVKEMIKSATSESCDNLDIDQLQKYLRDTLQGMRFLLILDDVWNDNRVKWMELRDLLRDGASGSKVIVTTRSPRVASIMAIDSSDHYNLEGLSHEESKSLFVKWAFREGQEYLHLLRIGDEIVRKCGGVPLALRTLGCLLYSKIDERDWLFIKNNAIWELKQKENVILPALRLSYDEMPSHLKRCFTFCSLFPKDHEFDSEELIQIWMAHDLIQSLNGNQDLEYVGEQYVEELRLRSLIQDVRNHGNYVTFTMHDLIHDLALSVAQSDCSIVNFATENVSPSVRHLSFAKVDQGPAGQRVPEFLLKLQSLRTIAFPFDGVSVTSQSFVYTCIRRFKYLRLLDLSGSSFEVLPSSIGSLKHLRYLDLSGNYRLEKLPRAICKLQSLQTLQFMGCWELENLPDDMQNLISLRYLAITTQEKRLQENGIGSITALRSLIISECINLEYLFDQGMHHLIALRQLCIGGCPSLVSLPRGIMHLTALETLVIDDCRKLNLNILMESEDHPSGGGLFRLRTLKLGRLPELMALPQLIQRSSNTLQYMRINDCFNLTELPVWLQNLSSLHTLRIGFCPELKFLPEGMQRLTSLKKLSIVGCVALSPRCQQETGEDWSKIAHVPKIRLDYNEIKPPK